jgi:hypothetical protein
VLKSEIGSAKVIGDGYAWIFYRNDEDLIDQHLKCQRQINLPPGIGGIGERAFAEKLQGLNGHFVLYHGITSYLRMGDVTFFDPATKRVKSIGELKSQQIGTNEYRVTLGLIYGPGIEPPIDITNLPSKVDKVKSGLSKAIESRLSRQLEEIRRAITESKESKSQTSLKTRGEYYFKELNQVIEGSRAAGFAYRKAGKNLLLGAIRVTGKRASQRAFGKIAKLDKKIDPVASEVKSIVDTNLEDNCLFVGTVGYGDDGFPTILPGTVPLAWWPLSSKNLHDLIFGKVVVMSMHNPAHFWQLLRRKGYSVTVGDRSQIVSAIKKQNERTIRLENMNYFQLLTENFLMSERTVINMVERSIRLAQKEKTGVPLKVNLIPRLKF